ncbi:MAG: ATP-binding protein [Alphaproteobacteria bacterium]|nr:ATP-binding protein [Alphaproteobacteria bacterium]
MEEIERLELWPLSRQYVWLDVYKTGATSLQLALRECLEPQTVETLTTALGDELELAVMNRRYLPTLLRDLQHLGLVSRKGDEYTTTDAGEALLDPGGEELLAEALCVRIKGFALLLRKLAEGSRTGPEVAMLLSPFTTSKSMGQLAQRHLWWARVAGVVTREGQTREITAAGRELVKRLPDDLPLPAPAEDLITEGFDEVEVVEGTAAAHPDLPTLWNAFEDLAAKEGILFGRDQVRALHTAWTFGERHDGTSKGVKRFAILSGLSGTGKTQLLLQYARAVCRTMGLDEDAHIALVPVRPDWRDPSGMLGYFNALHAEPTFQAEPALRLVIRASRHPHLPFFLLLDEMNLARVERYFAPFLSAMETAGDLDLHAFDEPVNGVPPTVRWPSNLRIGGTVNMDETTHAFSDKVLDRAFTLEFWDVKLEEFFQRRPRRVDADAAVEDALRAFQAVLVPIRRHVGYRTAGEVLDWVAAAREADTACPAHELIDQALFSKVLPRLRGHESKELEAALGALERLAKERQLVLCAAKLGAMRDRLRDTGVTGFWS